MNLIMTHYNRDYSNMPFLLADKAAIADVRQYANSAFPAIVHAARESTPLAFRMQMALLVGIEGYPVGALLREYNPATNETGDYGYPRDDESTWQTAGQVIAERDAHLLPSSID
jgi:hypothetical protein